jgi:hypothetical protein
VVVNGTATQARYTPAPGNKLAFSVTESATASKAVIKDVTLGKSLAKSGTGASNSQVMNGIDSLVNGTAQLPVPKFGRATFSAGKMDGKTVKAAGAIAVDMQTAAKVLQIHTGVLNTTGNGWIELFKHS